VPYVLSLVRYDHVKAYSLRTSLTFGEVWGIPTNQIPTYLPNKQNNN